MCIGFKCSVIFTHDEIIKKNPKNDMNEKSPFDDEEEYIERYVTHLMNH